jgi:hypothetical protein
MTCIKFLYFNTAPLSLSIKDGWKFLFNHVYQSQHFLCTIIREWWNSLFVRPISPPFSRSVHLQTPCHGLNNGGNSVQLTPFHPFKSKKGVFKCTFWEKFGELGCNVGLTPYVTGLCLTWWMSPVSGADPKLLGWYLSLPVEDRKFIQSTAGTRKCITEQHKHESSHLCHYSLAVDLQNSCIESLPSDTKWL